MKESFDDALGNYGELLEARVKNAESALRQAEANFGEADDSQKPVWQNRIDQRRAEYELLKAELESTQAEL